jgi:hydroxymethylpyrimidine/phosphomethylpyrimidine kinase
VSLYRRQAGEARRNLLICSGLDPSGGAGFIADVRIAAEIGVRPVGAITALTVQNTTGVTGYTVVDETAFRDQLDFLLMDVEVAAVKIGMLGSARIASELGKALDLTGAPLVWDPVLAPTRGDVRFGEGELEEPLAAIAPHLTLITPNLVELSQLVGRPLHSEAERLGAAGALATKLRAAVLVKGGHGEDDAESVDVLVTSTSVETLRGARVAGGVNVHGTGCALSTAIAAHLALGYELVDACRAAKDFVAVRIAAPVRPGRGEAAVV